MKKKYQIGLPQICWRGEVAFDYVSSFYEGGKWAKQVAKRLNDEGVRCEATKVMIAKNNEERDHMTKFEKDIIFDWSDKCLEVKSSTRDFTDDIAQYPFSSLFVDTVSGFDAKVEKPIAYVFISQKSGGMICISPKSYEHWVKINAFDNKRKIMEWFYSAPKETLLTIDVLVSFLLKKQEEAKLS